MTSVPPPPSALSATATTTPWPNRSWGFSRPSCTATPAALAQNGGPWKGLDDLEIATCAWVSWFNEERLHSELGDQTPAEFEADYRRRSSARRGMREPKPEPPLHPGRFTWRIASATIT